LGTRSESVPNLGGFEKGVETVSDVGEAKLEPAPVFEDFLGTSFDNMDRVADMDMDEEPLAPSETIQTKTNQIPLPEEGQRKKRIKTTAGRTNLPLVRKFLAMQLKPSDSPSQPKHSTTTLIAKPTRKSFRIASQSTSTAPKSMKPSKQEPILIEETGYSAESSPIKESETTSTKQGSPLIPPAKPSLKRKTTRKITLQTPVSKRMATPK